MDVLKGRENTLFVCGVHIVDNISFELAFEIFNVDSALLRIVIRS